MTKKEIKKHIEDIFWLKKDINDIIQLHLQYTFKPGDIKKVERKLKNKIDKQLKFIRLLKKIKKNKL